MSRQLPANESAPNPWLARSVIIDEIVPETMGVATFHLRFRDPRDADGYSFQPGQFNMLYIPGAGESAISLSMAPRPGGAGAHTIRLAGNVTGTIFRLAVGDTLGLRGPFGTGWPLDALRGKDVVIVAGGIGLAPLRSAIERIIARRQDYGQVFVLCGARSPELILYPREFDDWRSHGIQIETTVDRGSADWRGNVGVVTLLVERLPLDDPAQVGLLSCGPEVMMKYTARSALERGIPAQQIWCSLERNMQCAVGLCGHCQLGPEFLCKDGPVLRYDRVMSLLAVERL